MYSVNTEADDTVIRHASRAVHGHALAQRGKHRNVQTHRNTHTEVCTGLLVGR